MKGTGRRVAVVVTAVLAAMAFVGVATPAVSWADCDNGSVWNPLTNACLPVLPQPQ